MGNIAIIPARGGSKRIPRKNIKNFLGKPIIAYSIEAALKSGIFEEVMVSTDDEEIAAIARQYGASVPFMRSAEASSDTATDAMVREEVLREYEKRGKRFEYMAVIYSCAPFVTPQKLCDAMDVLQSGDADQTIMVTPFAYSPWKTFVIEDGDLRFTFPECVYVRSQDLKTAYQDCGQFYIFRIETHNKKKIEDQKWAYTIVPENEVQDINTEADWEMAELKYRRFILEEK